MSVATVILLAIIAWQFVDIVNRKKRIKNLNRALAKKVSSLNLDGWPEKKPRKKDKDLKVWSISDPSQLPYTHAGILLTDAELRFYRVLTQAVGHKLTICPKVRLADIVRCTDDEWTEGYGPPISQKHIDFVLTYPDSFKILCAVELDDSSHKAEGRRIRDEFVNAALASAGVPLVRRKVTKEYEVKPIRDHIWMAFRTKK